MRFLRSGSLMKLLANLIKEKEKYKKTKSQKMALRETFERILFII
jgi:hypothetical protein